MSTSPYLPADDPRAGSCGQCGAPLAADQRYCLSCGARREHGRLPFQDALAAPSYPVPAGPYAGAPPALWSAPPSSGPTATTMLAALACVLVAFGIGILVGDGGDAQQPLVVGGAAPVAAAAAPTTTTTDTTASTPEDDATTKDASASSGKAADTVPKRKLDASEKQEAEEISKTPAKVPKAKALDAQALKDLNSKDPDKAREASQSLPDVVSSGN